MSLIGSRIGPFEIVAPLGAGGMGEVYRARDTRLKRDVALKLLPAAVARDPDRLARFAREAELLASLNHPNIAAIYGVEDAGDATALVLELVDGPTLDTRIARGTLPMRDAVVLATQIASAVEAAHDRGVVHRDLKPANVKLTADGSVKVLDFGLAKALDTEPSEPPNGSTLTYDGTAAGIVLGTAPYMSPEQARGQPLDVRTDIWAFGCVLYELLTGRAAFRGRTTTDVLAAVVTAEPDWTRLPPDTPPAVVRVLKRTLEKDLKRRLRHIGDARLELDDAFAPAVDAAPRQRVAWAPWLVAASAIAIAAALWFGRAPAPVGGGDTLARLRVDRVTYDAGLTTMPAISRDGRLIAYASDRAGRGDLDIWVQLADGQPLRLTDDPADDVTPHFSPDGTQIVFRSERAGGGVYVVPALGGTPRLIAAAGRNPQFSPDGTRVAYWAGGFRGGATASSSTHVVPLGGGAPVDVLETFETARDPVWSPDGQSLLVAAVPERAGGLTNVDWWWVPLSGEGPVKTDASRHAAVRAGLTSTERAHWTAEGLTFSDGRDLWTLPVNGNGRPLAEPRRLTIGAQEHGFPSVSDNGRIVFASAVVYRVIGRAPLSADIDAPASLELHRDMRQPGGRASQTSDGSRIVLERAHAEGREIWMKTVADGREQLIARLSETRLLSATVSPDGSRVAYTAGGNGYVVDTTGGVPRQICSACQPFGFLSDNRRVLLMGSPPGDRTIRVADAVSGAVATVLQAATVNLNRPHVSPDDRWLAFRHEAAAGGKTFVMPLTLDRPSRAEDAAMIEEPTTTGRPAGWSADSRTLYLLLDTDGWRCLWAQSIGADGRPIGTPVPARHFHGFNDGTFGTSYGNAIAAGGVLFEGGQETANIWMLRVP